MPDYRTMYLLLSGTIADALDMLSGDADGDSKECMVDMLKGALLNAEDIYINTAGGGCIER